MRQLGIRGHIIKTMHQAMSAGGHEPDVSSFALHGEEPSDSVLGTLVKRGRDDELKIVAGIDGRTHHLRFNDVELIGDAPAGAIVEVRVDDDDHLAEEGLARRQGQRVVFVRDLIATPRRRELEDAASNLSTEAGLADQPAAEREHVSGVYRQRVTLASGRFAMVDDRLGFQLVLWRPALEKELNREVRGVMASGGNVEWSLGRKRGLGL